MNMIVNSSDLVGYEAENKKISWSKQDALSRVVKAWESRQGKSAKKLGGYSLLAISLAACNSSDDTPFAQSDIDAALTSADGTKHATVDAAISSNDAAVTTAALTAADGTVHATVDAAVTAGGGATTATTLTDSNGTTHASVDAAITSNDTSIANAATSAALTAADGTIYATVDAAYTAGNSLTTTTAAANATTAALTGADGTVHATVDAAVTSNDAAVQTAHETSLLTGTSFTSVADLITSYNALNSPAATSAALTTAADSLVGVAGANDTFTATNLTLTAGDVIVDSSSTDSDTLTVNVANATVAAGTTTSTISGIENVIFNFNSVGTPTATVTAMGSGTVTVNQASTAPAATVTSAGNVTVVGGTGVTGTLTVNQTAASALTVQAGNASTVTTTGGTTGSTTITGAAANIDTTVTTANITTSAAAGTIDINNVGAADAATVSAGATTTLTNVAVETLSLSGNGVASVITMDGTTANAATTTNLIGSQDLTVGYTQATGGVSPISSKTVTNTNTGNSTVQVTMVTSAGETEVYTSIPTSVTLDIIGTANAGDSISVSNGAVVTAGANLTRDLAIAMPASTASTNVLNITANQDQTAGITVTNAKTVNLTSAADTGTGADADGIMNLAAVAAGTANVVVTGSSPLTLAAGTTANKVDASALTGALTIAATVGNTATVTGGTGNDTFTLVNDAAGTWTGGAGVDTLVPVAAGVMGFQAATLAGFEIINADTNAATVMDFKASQLDGATYTIVADSGGASAIQVDDAAMMDSQTLDLSQLTLSGTFAAASVVVNASQVAASLSASANMTITGTALADTITGNNGTNTISSGAGNDIITGGTGVDIITAGAGADTITGGTGADVINLADGATAAVDTVIMSSGLTSDTINGFTTGTGGDDFQVGIAALETAAAVAGGVTLNLANLADGLDSAVAATADIQEIADQASGSAVAAAANVDFFILLTETYASTGAVETGLEIGDHELTIHADVAQHEAFHVVYSDGTDAHVAIVRFAANPGTDITTSDLTVHDLATITGVGTITAGEFVAANFSVIT